MQAGSQSNSLCVVIHPSEIVRSGLAMLVARQLRGWRIVEAAGIDDVDPGETPDDNLIVITDVAFSDNAPDLAAMNTTLRTFPNRVVVFCATPTSWGWGAISALQGGAMAVIGPESSVVDLHHALDAVVQQTKYVSADLAVQLAECGVEEARGQNPANRSAFGLTQSESTVLTELLDGAKLKELAHALSVSVKTVSSYKKRALKKLGVSSLLHVAGLKGALLSDHSSNNVASSQQAPSRPCFCP